MMAVGATRDDSQFSLRGLLAQLSLASVAMALIATESMEWISLFPTIIVLSLLIATRGTALRGAITGLVAASLLFLLLLVLRPFQSVPEFALSLVFFGSIGAWFGAALGAAENGYRNVAAAAFGLFLPVVGAGVFLLLVLFTL